MQIFKTIFKTLAASLLIAMIALLTYVHFESDTIKMKIENAVCQAISTDILISDQHIDPLSHFPNITFNLNGIRLSGTGDSPFIQAETIAGTITPFQLLLEHLNIRTLWIKGATIEIRHLSDNSWNYQIASGKGSDQSKSNFSFNINKAVLENVHIIYLDHTNEQHYASFIREGVISGRFTPGSLNLDLDLTMKSELLSFSSLSFCKGRDIEIKGQLYSDKDAGLVTLEDFRLQIPQTRIKLDGRIHQMEGHQAIDLTIDAENKDIGALVACLPQQWQTQLQGYELQGGISSKGRVSGRISPKENPSVNFTYQIEDGKLASKSLKLAVYGIHGEGTFVNGPGRNLSTSTVEIRKLKGKFEGKQFSGEVKIRDLNDPRLTSSLEGSVPFALFFPEKFAALEPSGQLLFHNFTVNDLWLSQFNFTDLGKIAATAEVKNLSFKLLEEEFKIEDGRIINKGDSLFFESLSLVHGKTEGEVSGWLHNLGDALEGQDAAYLQYSTTASLQTLDLGAYMQTIPLFATEGSGQSPAAEQVNYNNSAGIRRLPQGEIQLTVKEFEYGKLHARDLRALAKSSINKVDYELEMTAAEGLAHGDGTYTIGGGTSYLSSRVKLENVDMQKSFKSCNDFLQEVVTSSNISGKADLLMLVEAPFDDSGTPVTNQLKVYGGISIEQGELKDVEMLDQFSTYIHTDALKHIRFARLDNFFEVRNGQLFLPVLFIQSNAVNLAVNGIHRFDNSILYNFKINAGQVVAHKMKRQNTTSRPIEARKSGTFNLYYTIYGNLADFKYNMDRVPVLSSFRQSESIRDDIRERLQMSFGEEIQFIEPADWEDIPDFPPVDDPAAPPTFLDAIGDEHGDNQE